MWMRWPVWERGSGYRAPRRWCSAHPTLHGASVRSTDLRGGAALCVAALGAEGVTRVGDLCHIDRGYEDIARDLRALGADVVRQETDNN